jgi:uncharacterized phage-associated protein
MKIQFQLDIRKTVEAAAFLLKLNDDRMNYMGLLKMLYISDRSSLQRMNSPITGDQYYSLDYGPILSGVYDLIKGENISGENIRRTSEIWKDYISVGPAHHKINRQYKVSLLNDPGNGELCDEEESILLETYQKFGRIDPFDVAEWTHGLPEWQNPGGSRIPIDVEDILMYLQKTRDEIQEICQIAEAERYINQVIDVN